METKILEKIGLTKTESIVYLTLLKTGTSKTGDILNNSHLNSGKIYEILENLKNKGLVSESIINNIKHFTASPPSQIIEYIEKRKQELENDEKEIKAILPDFEKIRDLSVKKTKTVMYTGLKGIKTAADEALNSLKKNEEILSMGITEKKEKKLNDFWIKWTPKRVKKKVLAKLLVSEKGEYFKIIKKMKLSKVKVLESFTPVAIDIYGNNYVLIYNYKEPYGCISIYDEETVISFKSFFEQLWKIAKS
ncbi:hypothetical protein CL618_02125 [archaeon]|nr:hypothetical protein [archaeon]|tara:strand:- start:2391 stop:3137 length:747 start_codon:yes stop_codon:yes gene_type:complete